VQIFLDWCTAGGSADIEVRRRLWQGLTGCRDKRVPSVSAVAQGKFCAIARHRCPIQIHQPRFAGVKRRFRVAVSTKAVSGGPSQQVRSMPAALEAAAYHPSSCWFEWCRGYQAPSAWRSSPSRPAVPSVSRGSLKSWRNTGIDPLDLACLALEGSVQPPAEQRPDRRLFDLVDDILAAPELRQLRAVACGQFTDQYIAAPGTLQRNAPPLPGCPNLLKLASIPLPLHAPVFRSGCASSRVPLYGGLRRPSALI